ncbi:MAG: peroxidase-related enzyme [Rhodothermales bacterium]|nr:peroxidase-related enzyme [Rhodothermales bacterium]
MAWIRTIPHEEATDDLLEIYDEIIRKRGKLSNIMRIQSLNPKVMRSHMALYLDILFGKSDIRRADRELIATVVSMQNDCSYCTRHHAEALQHYWKDEWRIEKLLARDFDGADLTDVQRSMVTYAESLTIRPTNVDAGAIDELRDAGLNDKAILDLNLIVAYFNFVNRIAEGLGVTFDENEVGGYNY